MEQSPYQACAVSQFAASSGSEGPIFRVGWIKQSRSTRATLTIRGMARLNRRSFPPMISQGKDQVVATGESSLDGHPTDHSWLPGPPTGWKKWAEETKVLSKFRPCHSAKSQACDWLQPADGTDLATMPTIQGRPFFPKDHCVQSCWSVRGSL